MTTDPDARAFPVGQAVEGELGLTKREYIATQILSGLASNKETWTDSEVADQAVSLADALIRTLDEEKEA